MTLVLRLPFPPSTNTFYRNVVRGKRPVTLISEKGRDYKKQATLELKAQLWRSFSSTSRLRVCVWLYMPDKRRRDCDNYNKPLLDLMAAAGLYADDSQIDDLRVIRAGFGGYVLVRLEEIEGGLV